MSPNYTQYTEEWTVLIEYASTYEALTLEMRARFDAMCDDTCGDVDRDTATRRLQPLSEKEMDVEAITHNADNPEEIDGK